MLGKCCTSLVAATKFLLKMSHTGVPHPLTASHPFPASKPATPQPSALLLVIFVNAFPPPYKATGSRIPMEPKSEHHLPNSGQRLQQV
jgi:hypothetical protein